MLISVHFQISVTQKKKKMVYLFELHSRETEEIVKNVYHTPCTSKLLGFLPQYGWASYDPTGCTKNNVFLNSYIYILEFTAVTTTFYKQTHTVNVHDSQPHFDEAYCMNRVC